MSAKLLVLFWCLSGAVGQYYSPYGANSWNNNYRQVANHKKTIITNKYIRTQPQLIPFRRGHSGPQTEATTENVAPDSYNQQETVPVEGDDVGSLKTDPKGKIQRQQLNSGSNPMHPNQREIDPVEPEGGAEDLYDYYEQPEGAEIELPLFLQDLKDQYYNDDYNEDGAQPEDPGGPEGPPQNPPEGAGSQNKDPQHPNAPQDNNPQIFGPPQRPGSKPDVQDPYRDPGPVGQQQDGFDDDNSYQETARPLAQKPLHPKVRPARQEPYNNQQLKEAPGGYKPYQGSAGPSDGYNDRPMPGRPAGQDPYINQQLEEAPGGYKPYQGSAGSPDGYNDRPMSGRPAGQYPYNNQQLKEAPGGYKPYQGSAGPPDGYNNRPMSGRPAGQDPYINQQLEEAPGSYKPYQGSTRPPDGFNDRPMSGRPAGQDPYNNQQLDEVPSEGSAGPPDRYKPLEENPADYKQPQQDPGPAGHYYNNRPQTIGQDPYYNQFNTGPAGPSNDYNNTSQEQQFGARPIASDSYFNNQLEKYPTGPSNGLFRPPYYPPQRPEDPVLNYPRLRPVAQQPQHLYPPFGSPYYPQQFQDPHTQRLGGQPGPPLYPQYPPGYEPQRLFGDYNAGHPYQPFPGPLGPDHRYSGVYQGPNGFNPPVIPGGFQPKPLRMNILDRVLEGNLIPIRGRIPEGSNESQESKQTHLDLNVFKPKKKHSKKGFLDKIEDWIEGTIDIVDEVLDKYEAKLDNSEDIYGSKESPTKRSNSRRFQVSGRKLRENLRRLLGANK